MGRLAEEAAALFALALTAEQEAAFARCAAELAAWNAHTNLTAITDDDGIRVRHFLDSLSVVKALPAQPHMKLIDVGTGAGFPGVPLALVLPGARVTLLEATGKKIAFLDHLIAALPLPNADTLHARAEDAGHLPNRRAAYDVAVARAVARLPALLEYLLPLVKVGGRCIAMKGVTAHDEASDSRRALAALGGRLAGIEPVHLPGIDEPHYLVVVEKAAPTPAIYPRKPGLPTKKPIT
jgi:16S rRNA (guanine527-N7)-methyltransferase